jgi:hypothetical protein
MLKSLDWNAEYEVYVVAENQQGKSKAAHFVFRTSAQPTAIPGTAMSVFCLFPPLWINAYKPRLLMSLTSPDNVLAYSHPHDWLLLPSLVLPYPHLCNGLTCGIPPGEFGQASWGKGPVSLGSDRSMLTSLWDSLGWEMPPTPALPWMLVEQGSLMRLSLPSAFRTRTTELALCCLYVILALSCTTMV